MSNKNKFFTVAIAVLLIDILYVLMLLDKFPASLSVVLSVMLFAWATIIIVRWNHDKSSQ